jgi:hypothetical protein
MAGHSENVQMSVPLSCAPLHAATIFALAATKHESNDLPWHHTPRVEALQTTQVFEVWHRHQHAEDTPPMPQ